MKRNFTLIILALLHTTFHMGQESQPPYQSKMADLGEIQLEYMDFGGSGTPFLWVQDFHNYFDGPYKDDVFVNFFAKISEYTRVLAPLRRGYGKSTNTEWGYDVATQAEDLLHFMDALGIEKAILFGRLPANQDMTWIAEYRPERLAGLIYMGNPILIIGCHNPDELQLMENLGSMAPDFEKEKEKRVVMSRAFYRPRFLTDTNIVVKVPALRFKFGEFEESSVLRRLVEMGMLDEIVSTESPGYEEEQEAIRLLLNDSERLTNLKAHLIQCDPSIRMDQGLVRSFGTYMKTIVIDSDQLHEGWLDDLLDPISFFIKDIRN